MAQEERTPDQSDQPELDHTQPSPTQQSRQLDWRSQEYQASDPVQQVGGGEPGQETPPVRRGSRSPRRRRRPPTEGAPAWVVGLGVGALVAVIFLLVVAFVLSRRSSEPEPTPTAVVVTPTPTLIPRPTATVPLAVTATSGGAAATEETSATARPSGTISVGGFVRIAAPAGLSFRQSPSVNGPLVQVLDPGTQLEVIAGPREADGYTWWQLRNLDDDREGWSAAGLDGDVFLESIAAP